MESAREAHGRPEALVCDNSVNAAPAPSGCAFACGLTPWAIASAMSLDAMIQSDVWNPQRLRGRGRRNPFTLSSRRSFAPRRTSTPLRSRPFRSPIEPHRGAPRARLSRQAQPGRNRRSHRAPARHVRSSVSAYHPGWMRACVVFEPKQLLPRRGSNLKSRYGVRFTVTFPRRAEALSGSIWATNRGVNAKPYVPSWMADQSLGMHTGREGNWLGSRSPRCRRLAPSICHAACHHSFFELDSHSGGLYRDDVPPFLRIGTAIGSRAIARREPMKHAHS
jgi:hypothetical protein